MKLSVVAMILSLMFVTGCVWNNQLTESQQYQQADTSYRMSVKAMTGLSQAGAVSLETLEAFEKIRLQTNALLDAWGDSLVQGEPFLSEDTLDDLLDELIMMQLEAKQRSQDHVDGSLGSAGDHEGWDRAVRGRSGIAGTGIAGGSGCYHGGAGNLSRQERCGEPGLRVGTRTAA